MKPLNNKEVKEIHNKLKEQFGFSEKLDYLFYLNKENKIFLMSKDIKKLDLSKFRVNSFGLYFGEIEKTGLRLSLSGSQLIGKHSSKNILEIENTEDWLNGKNLPWNKELKGWFIIKNKNNFLGCGFCKNSIIQNFLPKH
ncbi:MAG: NIP7 N-terminal domain-related protein [Nanoarchaeota archaeon]